MEFLINIEIVSIFLRKEKKNPVVAEYMNKYSEKITKLIEPEVNLLKDFYKDNKVDFNNPPEFVNEGFLSKMGDKINNFNERVYLYYETVLTDEEISKVNDYLDSYEEELDNQMELLREEVMNALNEVEEKYINEKVETSINEEVQMPSVPTSDPVLN